MRSIRSFVLAASFVFGPAASAFAEPTPNAPPLVLALPSRSPVESLEPLAIASRLRLTIPKPSTQRVVRPVVDPLLAHVRAPAPPDRVGIGRTWNLGGGRELILDLTPSPTHCAPLASVTF